MNSLQVSLLCGQVSAAPRGRVPRCASLPGPAAAPIRRPCRRRRRRRRRRVLDEGAPPPRCARPSAGRVPGLAPPPAGRSPCPRRPASPAPLWGGWTDGRRGRASAVPVVVARAGRGGGGRKEGGPPPSSSRRTTPALPLVPPARWRRRAATLADPRARRAVGHPRRGRDRGGRVSRPGERPSRPPPPPGLRASSPHGGGRVSVPARASSPRPHRHARLLVVVLASPYLVDPASSICLSQRLSHACLSTHGRYSETANGSLNQLWFLWSLAPLLLG